MDENLLNYINTMKNSDENTNEMNTFENKKREVKSSDIDYPATIENYKNKTAQRNKNTSRSEKNQFPTEKINKKKVLNFLK